MTWLDHFACALVDQAAIQSAVAEGSGPVCEVPSGPVTCTCGRTAESEAEAIAKLWARTWSGWRCAGCNAPGSVTIPAPDDGSRPVRLDETVRDVCDRGALETIAAYLRGYLPGYAPYVERIVAALDGTPSVAKIRALALETHLERVLAIVTEVGGYLSQEHQDAIRAAREAVR